MKKFILAAATALSAAFLAGCAELQQAENFINSASTQQSVVTLELGAKALVCAIANVSALAYTIETQYAGQSIIGTDGKVYVTSAAICTALGGTAAGTGTIP